MGNGCLLRRQQVRAASRLVCCQWSIFILFLQLRFHMQQQQQ